jgi:hypothetical protein
VSTDLDRLLAAKYLLLTTFRKDGSAVPTAVWFARDDDGGEGSAGVELLVWTVTGSGKVKRLRRDGTVTIAACDVRGKPTGTAIDGQARLLDAQGSQRTRDLIARRYGLFGRLTMLGSRLRRGPEGTIGIAITPAAG